MEHRSAFGGRFSESLQQGDRGVSTGATRGEVSPLSSKKTRKWGDWEEGPVLQGGVGSSGEPYDGVTHPCGLAGI